MSLCQDGSNVGSSWLQTFLPSSTSYGLLVDGYVRVMGGSNCSSSRLISTQVRQINSPVLVAGSETLWTRGGSITCDAISLWALLQSHNRRVVAISSPINPMARSFSMPESRGILNVIALT